MELNRNSDNINFWMYFGQIQKGEGYCYSYSLGHKNMEGLVKIMLWRFYHILVEQGKGLLNIAIGSCMVKVKVFASKCCVVKKDLTQNCWGGQVLKCFKPT